MKKFIRSVVLASGLLAMSSAYAGSFSPIIDAPVLTISAELICKTKSVKDKTQGFVAASGNYAVAYNGAIVARETLSEVIAHNPSWLASTGAPSPIAIPCTAAVAEIQRYVFGMVAINAMALDTGSLIALLTNIKTGNPTVTHLSDDSIVYTWVMAVVIPS